MWRKSKTAIFVQVSFIALFLFSCGSLIPANHQNKEFSEWKSGEYKLDSDHASLIFSLNHLGFSSYVGRFNTLDASLDFDPEKPLETRLSASVEITSLDVNNPEFSKTLKGSDWFDAKSFPKAYLESTEIIPTGDKTAEFRGNLTMKGKTHPITMDVTFNGGAVNFLTGKYTLGFMASGEIKRSDFGISNLVPAIGDEVQLQISAEFFRVSGS
mgnify:CR=1 FL=1